MLYKEGEGGRRCRKGGEGGGGGTRPFAIEREKVRKSVHEVRCNGFVARGLLTAPAPTEVAHSCTHASFSRKCCSCMPARREMIHKLSLTHTLSLSHSLTLSPSSLLSLSSLSLSHAHTHTQSLTHSVVEMPKLPSPVRLLRLSLSHVDYLIYASHRSQ